MKDADLQRSSFRGRGSDGRTLPGRPAGARWEPGAAWLTALLALCFLPIAIADDSVVSSKHDLSTFGPGPVRSPTESQVCIFCHTPHNSSPAAPLWNRHNPTAYYRIYSSSTTDARIDQPGGTSKMCLSCHDGSIALGMVLSRDVTDPIPLNHPYMPSGPGNLTNDLSDDHPIGLRYDRQLANRDAQLRSPDLVSPGVELGPRGELECIACHDPHNNRLGDFLRIPTARGALCTTCHQMDGWQVSAHALSGQNVPVTLTDGQQLAFRSMADNACLSCHKTHSANQPERLLRAQTSQLCISCHDGFTGRDVLSVLNQRSGHVNRFLAATLSRFSGSFRGILGGSRGRSFAAHDPAENPLRMPPHVECADCHNPHAVRANPLGNTVAFGGLQGVPGLAPGAGGGTGGFIQAGPWLPPAMEHVGGLTLSGLPIERARFYYEVCFRCHADNPAPIDRRIIRQRDEGGNVRREFLPTAASAHPVAYTTRSAGETPSLLAQFRNARFISCQDCHNNPDARQLGGSTANGPHGSRFDFLLARRYETADFTTESPQAYALCYACHDRNSILNNESFSLHNLHVVRGRSPCSSCHDAHGVSGSRAQHGHLINFDLAIVGGERFYADTGRFTGTCTLTCHGVRHVNFTYGPRTP